VNFILSKTASNTWLYQVLIISLFMLANLTMYGQETSSGDTVAKDTSAHKSGYTQEPAFGDRRSVQGQLEYDDRESKSVVRLPFIDKALAGWYNWKRKIYIEHGLQIGVDYAMLAHKASKTMTNEDFAWSGAFRIYARYAMINRNKRGTGFLSLKIENRSAVGSYIPPKQLGSQFGYVSVSDVVFSDDGNLLTEMSYQQRFGKNDQGGLVIGRFDPNSYMSVLGYSNPWSTFSNLNLLLNTSVALHDFSWGIGGGSWLGKKEQMYVSGSINDANGNIRTNVEWFTGGAEFFKQVEVGFAPDRQRRLYTKISLAYWHIDERKKVGASSSHGIVLDANKTFNNIWMIFFRGGHSFGKATGYPFYSETLMVGFGKELRFASDRIGFAAHWGAPSDNALNDEWTMEAFYRLQFAKPLQLTPSIQYIINPAKNVNRTNVFVFGVRMRFVL
jgi:porin